MSIQTGIGESYRRASWLERFAGAAGRNLTNPRVRRVLGALFHRALSWLPGDHLICRLPDGEVLRIDAAHRFIGWNAIEYRALKASVRPGAHVLDIGANVGAYTVLLARWAGPQGHVYAFEPAPAARTGLERHLALNGLSDRVTIVPEAVAGTSGTASFEGSGFRGDNRLTGVSRPAAGPLAGTIEVRTTTIDEFCGRLGAAPDVIKMDIEGAELMGLQGARHTIAAAGPSLALFVEFHPTTWPSLGVTRGQMEEELRRQHLVIEPTAEYADPWSVEGVCVRLRRES